MERKEVYKVIDSERDYQDIRWGEFDDINNNPADWILYMEKHLNDAKTALYNSHDMPEFGNEIRKVTALGVACMEYYDSQKRYGVGIDTAIS